MTSAKRVFYALSAILTSLGITHQVYAQSSVTLFGVLDDGIVHTYKKAKENGKKTTSNVTELRSGVYRGARWGIRGKEDLGGGYSIGFMLDSGFRDDDGGQTMNRIFGREASLNVKGPFGELYLGRIGAITSGAGPMAVAAWYSPFGTSCGQIAVTSYNYMFNFQRVDNSYSYRSPTIGNTRFLLQYSGDVNALEDIDSNKPGTQHGIEGKSSTSHYYAAGLQYNNKTVDFNVGADHLTYSRSASNVKPESSYSLTAGGSVKFQNVKLYAGAQLFWHATSKWMVTYNKLWNEQTYLNGFSIIGGAEYQLFGGLAMAAAGYNKTRSGTKNVFRKGEIAGLSLGYAYPLSKRTTLYFIVNSGYSTNRRDSDKTQRTVITEEAIGLTHFF